MRESGTKVTVKCLVCGSFHTLSRQDKKIDGNITLSKGRICRVCHYRDTKNRFKRQLLLDLDNKVYVNGKWIKSQDNSRLEDRLSFTLYHLYETLGETIGQEVLYNTLKYYWYKNFFTIVNNPRARVSSQ